MSRLAVAHAVYRPESLRRFVAGAYDLGRPDEVRLLVSGLNDSYLVRRGRDRYVLRIYRRGWRTRADVGYELDVLVHLDRKGVPVAAPLPRRDGDLFTGLKAPEGERFAALFAYAPGAPPRWPFDADYSRRYGAAVAAIHAATEDFRSQHDRFRLDAEHLLETPLRTVVGHLARRPDDVAFLERLADRLRARFADLERRPSDRGFCHGDFHGGNVHDDGGRLTFYDFDCCGPGWRAYDVAVFRWPLEWQRKATSRWPAFLEGYRGHRQLAEVDEAATHLFVAARELWHIWLHVGGGPKWGYGWNALDDGYLDRKIGFLRRWSARHLGLRPARSKRPDAPSPS
jgi:Ser/Thr protein kinase RdoA (MazF antagonist)